MKIIFDFWTWVIVVIAVMIPVAIGFVAGYCARMRDELKAK